MLHALGYFCFLFNAFVLCCISCYSLMKDGKILYYGKKVWHPLDT